jgi:hypothetical protein
LAWTPTETLFVEVPPCVSTGGDDAPVEREPWQNVQFVAQLENPALAWHGVQDWAEPPFRSWPWQVLHDASPVRFTEYPCWSLFRHPAACPPEESTFPFMWTEALTALEVYPVWQLAQLVDAECGAGGGIPWQAPQVVWLEPPVQVGAVFVPPFSDAPWQ